MVDDRDQKNRGGKANFHVAHQHLKTLVKDGGEEHSSKQRSGRNVDGETGKEEIDDLEGKGRALKLKPKSAKKMAAAMEEMTAKQYIELVRWMRTDGV